MSTFRWFAQHGRLLAILLVLVSSGCIGTGQSEGALEQGESSVGVHGVDRDRLAACGEGAWSPEVDTQVQDPEPSLVVTVRDESGGPILSNEFGNVVYISDGDLISMTEPWLCALNAELLYGHYGEYVRFDLGLDAAHILDFEAGLVAFSTELDDPLGMFTDGDLLFSTGGRIPNRELMYALQWREWKLEPFDLGLDALHLVGPPERFAEIVKFAVEAGRQDDLWSPGQLQKMLKENGVDIWFSIEGTVRISLPGAEEFIILPDYSILDGDVVSARDGTVVTTQGALRPNTDADFRDTISSTYGPGCDYGLDALSGPMTGEAELLFSIENDVSHGRTDSDILIAPVDPALAAATVFISHARFGVNSLGTDDFLGLDALWHPE